MDNSIDTLKEILFVLYGILAVLAYLAFLFTAAAFHANKKGKSLQHGEEARVFQAKAQELIKKADYASVKLLAESRLTAYPGDATAEYYFGMACLRSRELVAAKDHFTRAMNLDAQWKKLCTGNLEEIETELKNKRPALVE